MMCALTTNNAMGEVLLLAKMESVWVSHKELAVQNLNSATWGSGASTTHASHKLKMELLAYTMNNVGMKKIAMKANAKSF